jgi:hypothetical protein
MSDQFRRQANHYPELFLLFIYVTPGCMPIVLWDNRELPREGKIPAAGDEDRPAISEVALLDGSARQNAEPFGDGNQFSQGLHLHLLHDAVTMSLDGTLRGAQLL